MATTRTNSQPAPEVAAAAQATPDNIRVAQAITRGKETARRWGQSALGFAKARPYMVLGVLTSALTLGYFGWPGGSSTVPVAEAGLPAAQPSKVVSTGQSKTVEFVVGSYRKTDRLLILNNHPDYRQATMNVVVDLQAAPELAAVSPRSLKGRRVKASGELQTYDGKPQVKVTRADDLEVDPKGAEKKG